MFSDDLFLYVSPLTCFDYNGNGQLIAQHQWKVPSKEENARNGLPETDWRDAQYDMLYLPVTETVRYHYDFNGNRTATVLPDGRQINYLYYGSGHLHQISLDDEVITDIERDQLHREIYRTQGKLASRYELDPLGRLKRQIATLNDLAETGKGKTKVAAGYAVKRSYGYDRTGNLTHSTDQRTGTTHFEYDKLGRITKAGNELFAFDPAHNILDIPTEKVKPYPAPSPVGEGRGEGKTTAPLSDDLNPITDNRLKTYNGTTYYYDDLGNLIHRELADGEVQNYFYDLHDQLVNAEIFKKDGTKETWSYTYDALGRRIGKGRLKDGEVLGSLENQTRFVWDGSHLLQEIHLDGRYTYIYTDPSSYEPLAQVRDWTTEDGENRQQTRYFHCDQIGIPREMTDKDGNLLWFGNYTDWGRLKEENKVTDSAYQPFRLQNQYADLETGLHYNFFRYYESDCGRFINQDPIGLKGSNNLYTFAPNVQISIDPLGLAAIDIPLPANPASEGIIIRAAATLIRYSPTMGLLLIVSGDTPQKKEEAPTKPVPSAIAQNNANKKGSGKCTRADTSIAGAGAGAPMPPDNEDEKKNEKSSIDNIVKDKDGNYIGKVNKGATENIRTVSKQEFDNIRKELLKNSKKVGEYSNGRGTWYELPNGDKFGIRHSSRHGETMDFNVKGLPRDFKIHQK